MGLRTVVKLGTIVSVALFCIAVGYYAFMQLNMADRNREVNLFALVPDDCVSVFETDNVNEVLNEIPQLRYNRELENVTFSGLFGFILNVFNEYAIENAHGLSHQMNRVLVSNHYPYGPTDQVIYFRMGASDESMLANMLQEYAPFNFLPKEEKYRGKTIKIYPLGTDEYLAAYSESGCLVISYHERLLEKVIDAKLDGKSLNDDTVFVKMLNHKKSQTFLTLYTRASSLPFLNVSPECWSDYDFHINSDVLYLTGYTYMPDSCVAKSVFSDFPERFTLIEKDSLFITTEKDSIHNYITSAYEDESTSLFEQNVVNLSKDATFTMVADMQLVADDPSSFVSYFPSSILNNISLFRPFILSSQYMLEGDGLAHIWIFTYKD